MSVRIMTAAWAVDMPAGDKLVLLALADCANDEGHCWPGLASLARKTGKCKRSLQESLRSLDQAGHITRDENPGKGMNYTVHPVAKSAPVEAVATGSKNTSKPVAKSAPKPSGTVRGIEASASTLKAWALPAGVSFQVWQDLMTNRKRKRLPNTPTAWKSFNDDLARISAQTGIPPPKLIEHAAAKGWGGIYDPNERGQPNGQPQPSLRGSRPDPALDLLRAAERAEEAERTHGEDHRGARPPLQAIGRG